GRAVPAGRGAIGATPQIWLRAPVPLSIIKNTAAADKRASLKDQGVRFPMAKIPYLKYVPYVAAVFIMGVSCYVQGMWSERWGTFPELKMFADQLKEIPKDIGDWRGEDSKETDARILKVAGAEGELVRVYTNAAGQSVQVSIICARMRDIFYHTPDRCYPAAG